MPEIVDSLPTSGVQSATPKVTEPTTKSLVETGEVNTASQPVANPAGNSEFTEQDWQEFISILAENGAGKLADFVISGGPGGYFGAGPEHAPLSEGVVDTPELTIPERFVEQLGNLAKGADSIVGIIGKPLAKGISATIRSALRLVGQDITIGGRSGVSPGQPLSGKWLEAAKAYDAAGGRELLDAHHVAKAGEGNYVYSPNSMVGELVEIIIGVATISTGGSAAGAAKVAGIASLSSKLVQYLSRLSPKKLSGFIARLRATLQKAPKGVKASSAGKALTAAEIKSAQVAAKSFAAGGTFSTKLLPSGLLSSLKKAGAAAANAFGNKVLSLAGGTIKGGATIAVEFGIYYTTISGVLKTSQQRDNLTEDEIHSLAMWAAYSIILSRLGAKYAGKIRGGGSFFSNFVISEGLQYIVFTGAGGGGNTTVDQFIRWAADNPKSTDTLLQPQAKNRGGLVALNRGGRIMATRQGLVVV